MCLYFAHTNGNTFILVDALHCPLEEVDLKALLATLVKENRDDALILTDKQVQGDLLIATMQVLGQDGVFAEFCGNGSLAAAAFLFTSYPQFQCFALRTPHGLHPLYSHGTGIYSIVLPLPSTQINPLFIADAGAFFKEEGWTYVEMLEPHLVMHTQCSEEDLLEQGKRLNALCSIFPKGINLNVYSFTEEGDCHVKTYERGVQRLTAACGTGSIACVVASHIKTKMRVVTRDGSVEVTVYPHGIELKGIPIIEKLFLNK